MKEMINLVNKLRELFFVADSTIIVIIAMVGCLFNLNCYTIISLILLVIAAMICHCYMSKILIVEMTEDEDE